MSKIGFIGGGNMASSLIGGLLSADFTPEDILVTDPDEQHRRSQEDTFQVATSSDNNETLCCEIIILAVKPQILKTVSQQLDTSELTNTLFISIAAGVNSKDISRWLADNRCIDKPPAKTEPAIVRCMPNTPALVQCGATGLYANKAVSDEQKQQADKILQAVGLNVWVEDESQLDAVTAISGSGPAYFFLMMEAMQNAGEKLGLNRTIANRLVIQTALGAARMASEDKHSPAELRKRVTSPGGTTEQAILSFQSTGYEKIVDDAIKAAHKRSISLAEELGSD